MTTSNGKTATCTVTVTELIQLPEGVERIYGDARYQTAIVVADALKEELGISKFETVIIATGVDYPDALAGSYLAGKKNAPILMVNDRYMDDVATYVRNNVVTDGKVYILGIQNNKNQNKNNLCKKIDRYFRKMDKGLEAYEQSKNVRMRKEEKRQRIREKQ